MSESVTVGYVVAYCVVQLVAMVLVMIPAYFLGKETAEYKAARKRDAEEDARLGL